VNDGDAFVVDVSAIAVCFATPPALHDRAPCNDLDPARLASLSTAKLQFLAVGLVTLEGGRRAMLSVARAASDEAPTDEQHLAKAGREFRSAMQGSIGSVGVVRDVRSRLIQIGTLPVLRMSTGLDGVKPGTNPMVEYHTTAVFFARGAGYSITVNGQAQDGAAIESLVDALAGTVRLASPNREPPHDRTTLASLAGRIVGSLLCLAVVVAALALGRKRKEHAAAAASAPPRARKKKRQAKDDESNVGGP
jgi:hypothetical protein